MSSAAGPRVGIVIILPIRFFVVVFLLVVIVVIVIVTIHTIALVFLQCVVVLLREGGVKEKKL